MLIQPDHTDLEIARFAREGALLMLRDAARALSLIVENSHDEAAVNTARIGLMDIPEEYYEEIDDDLDPNDED